MTEDRKNRVISFILKEIEMNGVPPSLRELGKAMNFSHDTARKTLIALERDGSVRRKQDKARAIKVLRIPAAA